MGEHAPEDPSHRMLVSYVLAVVGILAVGDGLNVIWFPLYTLGLPDSATANTLVVLFGVGLFVAAYRLARSANGGGQSAAVGDADAPLADGSTYGDRTPKEVLELRYAEGALSDDEFAARKSMLQGDSGESDATARQTQIKQANGLTDRETTIE